MNESPIPHRRLGTREVARILDYSEEYVRDLARDQERSPHERRLPEDTHRHFPPMKKIGGRYKIWGPDLKRWIQREVGSTRGE